MRELYEVLNRLPNLEGQVEFLPCDMRQDMTEPCQLSFEQVQDLLEELDYCCANFRQQ